MPARPPLDLSDITRQYGFFREEPPKPEAPVLPGDSGSDRCFARAPVRLGRGPDVWSTSTELVPVVPVCYDVNGYYRELGVHWQATRRELAQAYVAKDGAGSVRLTYVLRQLLNVRIRDAYDRASAGQVFPDDYTDEQRQAERAARREAARRRIQGEAISVEAVLDEMGYVVLDEVDSVSPMMKDQGQRPEELWGYSYYAWKTAGYSISETRLRQWQELLSTAASRRRVAPQVAIGMTTLSDRSVMLVDVNGASVIFFSEATPPDLSIAEEAIGLFPASSPHHAEIPEESRIP